jgi:hypothetical protein
VCLVRTKIEKAGEFFIKYLSGTYHEKPSSDLRVVMCGQTDEQCCFNRCFAEMMASLKRSLAIRMQLAFVLWISVIKATSRTELCVPEHALSVVRQLIYSAVRKIAKSNYLLRRVCCTSARPNGRGFVKFDTWVFSENLSRKFKLLYNLTRITQKLGTLIYIYIYIYIYICHCIRLRMRNFAEKNL